MTSLNAPVIITRQIISLFIRRIISENFGEAGQFMVGQLRSVIQMLTSTSSVGIFNGIVKYVSEYREDDKNLLRLFSTAYVFSLIGTVVSALVLLIGAEYFSTTLFDTTEYTYLIRLIAVVVPFIALQRIFNGVVNGLSQYKRFAKIDIISYLLSAGLTIYFLFANNFDGVLMAIAITPAIQLVVLLFFFFGILKQYIHFKGLTLKTPMARLLLAFALMSFGSTVIMSLAEIGVRNLILHKISKDDAGIWSSMLDLSKNYMAFSSMLFTMYVIPKFALIKTKGSFLKEVGVIYKTLLPIFGAGMILVYLFRNVIIDLIFPGFYEMEPLFKWQLIGDFIRLMGMVLSYQFIAKKQVLNFIFTEILSVGLFVLLATYLIDIYGVQGVVIGHLLRYVVYLIVVFFLVYRYFTRQGKKIEQG